MTGQDVTDKQDIDKRLAVAEAVARRAGALALEHFRNRGRLVIETRGRFRSLIRARIPCKAA